MTLTLSSTLVTVLALGLAQQLRSEALMVRCHRDGIISRAPSFSAAAEVRELCRKAGEHRADLLRTLRSCCRVVRNNP